jgi:hypothetical protein
MAAQRIANRRTCEVLTDRVIMYRCKDDRRFRGTHRLHLTVETKLNPNSLIGFDHRSGQDRNLRRDGNIASRVDSPRPSFWGLDEPRNLSSQQSSVLKPFQDQSPYFCPSLTSPPENALEPTTT